MREHMGLYRGKRTDNGEWVEGNLLKNGEAHRPSNRPNIPFSDCYIVPKTDRDIIRLICTQTIALDVRAYHIDPDTVGECTGLTDKNGKLIFEGDVVRMPHEYKAIEKIKGCYGYDSEGYPQRIPGYTGSGEYPTVKRGFKNCPVKFNPSRGFYAEGTSFFLSGIDVEVIGNVVDYPELLEGGEG